MKKYTLVLSILFSILLFSKSFSSDNVEVVIDSYNGDVKTLLNKIIIKNEVKKNYNRDNYKHWLDEDKDRCDTRREVLQSESLIKINNCFSNKGEWLSLYDGKVFYDARELDIDHVVSLAEADRSGAWAWSNDKKSRFANDLDSPWSLIAVSRDSNRFKSDKDPTFYKPNSGICEYSYSVIITKWRWNLSVDKKEYITLTNNIKNCNELYVNIKRAI
jgi:hypothetical protein